VENEKNYETHVSFAVGNRFGALQICLLMHHYGVINIAMNVYDFILRRFFRPEINKISIFWLLFSGVDLTVHRLQWCIFNTFRSVLYVAKRKQS
jgi:hypothetical protein